MDDKIITQAKVDDQPGNNKPSGDQGVGPIPADPMQVPIQAPVQVPGQAPVSAPEPVAPQTNVPEAPIAEPTVASEIPPEQPQPAAPTLENGEEGGGAVNG